MAKRPTKPTTRPTAGRARQIAAQVTNTDKFRVGQEVILALDAATQWERGNGEFGVVVGPKKSGTFSCNRLGATGPGSPQHGERYAVRWKGGVSNFEEEQLRAIYDGERLSTWEKFAKATGLQIGIRSRSVPVPKPTTSDDEFARKIFARMPAHLRSSAEREAWADSFFFSLNSIAKAQESALAAAAGTCRRSTGSNHG
jgi:hypothetical protein